MSELTGIRDLTDIILRPGEDNYGGLHSACDRLYHLLLDLTGLEATDEENRKNQSLQSGNAIGLSWAAMCIKDIMRTRRFMTGVFEAVSDLLQRKGSTPINILYAGTGPFATLILPLLSRFSPRQIQLTLLEVNTNSYEALKKLVGVLDISAFVRRLENADATNWRVPGNEVVDIFICEAMQQALKDEPQVAIFRSIIPQLQQNTIVIPQRVKVQLALVDMAVRMREKKGEPVKEASITVLEDVFVLDRDLAGIAPAGRDKFPYIRFPIPQPFKTGSSLYLTTEIQVYKNTWLTLDESALTLPLSLPASIASQIEVCLQYETGRSPGIKIIPCPSS